MAKITEENKEPAAAETTGTGAPADAAPVAVETAGTEAEAATEEPAADDAVEVVETAIAEDVATPKHPFLVYGVERLFGGGIRVVTTRPNANGVLVSESHAFDLPHDFTDQQLDEALAAVKV